VSFFDALFHTAAEDDIQMIESPAGAIFRFFPVPLPGFDFFPMKNPFTSDRSRASCFS
jgi:hypothetical protein